jgi:hypothetical protein
VNDGVKSAVTAERLHPVFVADVGFLKRELAALPEPLRDRGPLFFDAFVEPAESIPFGTRPNWQQA